MTKHTARIEAHVVPEISPDWGDGHYYSLDIRLRDLRRDQDGSVYPGDDVLAHLRIRAQADNRRLAEGQGLYGLSVTCSGQDMEHALLEHVVTAMKRAARRLQRQDRQLGQSYDELEQLRRTLEAWGVDVVRIDRTAWIARRESVGEWHGTVPEAVDFLRYHQQQLISRIRHGERCA